jgi:NYN domain
VTDMIALARNRAISDAVLVSGDEDLRVGVQQAQEFGVRVHLIGIKPSHGSQSLFLLQEADTTHEWSNDEISVFLRCQPVQIPPDPRPAPAAPRTVPVQVQDPLKGVAVRVVARLELTEIQALVETVERMGQIPRDIDKQLLGGARAEIGRDLNSSEKRRSESILSKSAAYGSPKAREVIDIFADFLKNATSASTP